MEDDHSPSRKLDGFILNEVSYQIDTNEHLLARQLYRLIPPDCPDSSLAIRFPKVAPVNGVIWDIWGKPLGSSNAPGVARNFLPRTPNQGPDQGLQHIAFKPLHNVPENAHFSGDLWRQLNATCFRPPPLPLIVGLRHGCDCRCPTWLQALSRFKN